MRETATSKPKYDNCDMKCPDWRTFKRFGMEKYFFSATFLPDRIKMKPTFYIWGRDISKECKFDFE